jgi:ribosomal-protein-alanine N-acetyltransferase
MQIHAAQLSDIPAIYMLETACFPDPWSQKSLRETMRENTAIMLLATENGHVAGYLCASYLLDECELNRICILPQFRRLGGGKQLLDALETACSTRGVTQIFLEVREGNTAARRLYTQAGFSEIGLRKRYYKNPEEAAVLMCRALPELKGNDPYGPKPNPHSCN